MSPFEFVTVLISIILGLGITQIMSGIADLIHQWGRVRLYWPHLLWVALVFILHIQEWWLLFQLRSITVWKLPMFLFQVLYPICLFILARILFPMPTEENGAAMKQYYLSNYRKLFILVMLLSALSAIENIFVHHLGGEGWYTNAALFLLLLVLALQKSISENIHKILAVVLMSVMVAGIIVNVNEWLITN